MNFSIIRIFILLFIFSCSDLDKDKKIKRPNILLIVADDLGYTDLGCFGSEINTPNIDVLSRKGVIFSNFYTSPLCAPTRAMLLSGNSNHIAGMGIQGFKSELFGYEGQLTDRIMTMPSLLQKSGYHTYIAGKWHLGSEVNSNPINKGFEKSYVLLPGAGNHYSNRKVIKNYSDSSYSENGKRIKWEDGNYSTDFYTDKIIEYIKGNKDKNKPFFAFATYTSPHWPLQVNEKFSNKYRGIYDKGYDELKMERFNNLKRLKIIPSDALIPESHSRLTSWKDLSEQEKKIESKKMEIYAGMVENLDFNVGRILHFLKEINEYENTLIIFMSDNGAAGEDFYNNPIYGPYLKKNFTVKYDDMGKENSFISLGTGWAEASSAPFKYFKGFSTQGGIVSPIIMSGYGVNRKNEISNDFVTLLDIAPTFYEFASVNYPNQLEYPLLGVSLKKYLNGIEDQIHDDDYVFGFEHSGYAFIKKGNWKLVNYNSPFEIGNFKLYNVTTDISESRDLKINQIEKYHELLNEWKKFSNENQIIIPTPYTDNIN